MKLDTIHQFSPAVTQGDGVTNALFLTQKILLDLGFKSKIYSNNIDEELKSRVLHVDNYKQSENQILLYHHSIGHEHHDIIMNFKDKKILVYHNITPSHFFKNNKDLKEACILGREQLKAAKDSFISSYTDSDYNALELKFIGYKNPKTMSILTDLNMLKSDMPNEYIIKKYAYTYNILFVGRVVSNKCQHQLIDVIYYLKKQDIKNIKLFIVGGISEPDYSAFLNRYIENLDLQDQVEITNKVDDKDLAAYYTNADLYLSLSEHEGFGIPLLEAMSYDIPVLAYHSGGISSVVTKQNLLYFKSANSVAKEIIGLMQNSYKRVEIIKLQRENLKRFSYKNLKHTFVNYLESLHIQTPIIQVFKKDIQISKTNYQIEGPFDSSYSLAIVNANLAKSFYLNKENVKLYSTEGYGDFKPNDLALQKDKLLKTIYTNKFQQIDITIRNLYPPRTNAMKGYQKIIGPYGWEESTFPSISVDQFNIRLSLLACMSEYVKNVMIKNGVKIPICVTGVGVDHILQHKAKAIIDYVLPKGFKLLHISSCFPRKGIDILLEVFKKLINDGISISLVIKTFPNPHNNILLLLEKLPLHVRKHIVLINKDLELSHINYLYQNCDCLIAPSRGEGFGLPAAEAMLFGMPVITTAFGGQIDFCKPQNAWLVDYSFKKAKTHMKLFNSYWVEPSQKSLEKNILDVYNSTPQSIKIKTDKAKKYILENYKWIHVVERLKKVLLQPNTKKQTKIKNIAWISTYNTKCGIATYSQFILNHLKESNITIFANHSHSVVNQNREINTIRCWDSRFDKNNSELIENIIKKEFTHVVINFNFAFFSMPNLKQIIEALHAKGIKITIIFHSVADVTSKGIESSLSWIKNSLKKVDHLLVHNIDDLNFFKNLNLQNMDLFPHGVQNRINTLTIKESSTYTIASYGFLLPHKGILELIEAFSLILKTFPNTKLLLVTSLYPVEVSNDYLKLCEKRVKELNLEEKIQIITDFLTDKKSFKLLDTADLLVMPYRKTQESSSAAVRHAISTCKPILCTNQPIFNDVSDIIHFAKGFSAKDLAFSIKELMSNKELLTSKLTRQKEWIQEHDWKNIAKKLENILKETE